MGWSCCHSLCKNNFTTPDVKGYRLPQDQELQTYYISFLKTDGINFKTDNICSEHWSKGARDNTSDLPDISVPDSQMQRLENEVCKIEEKLVKSPGSKDLRTKLKTAKRNVEVALQLREPIKPERAPPPPERAPPPPPKKRLLSHRELTNKVNKQLERISSLEQQVEQQSSIIQQQQETIEQLNMEVSRLQLKNSYIQTDNNTLQHKVAAQSFTYSNLVKDPDQFKYMCGLTVDQFQIVNSIVEPYSHCIEYPDCKGTGSRALDKATELLVFLTICRHALHLGIMAYILNLGESTVHRIFVGWAVFLDAFFNKINLKPKGGYLISKMPDIFIKTGHGLTDIVIDCTEFKFNHATNLELNSLMFSNYKNTQTGKALIGISPHGSGLLFSDIYPGSITDSEITEKSGVIEYVEEEHEIMADKGFAIQDICANKGIFFNRPAQKNDVQFIQADIAGNFDIASTRIHVERYIGRVRNWAILNSVWPMQRVDLLSSVWQVMCHIVNLTMSPIGPKVD